jgi:hypothetical protein
MGEESDAKIEHQPQARSGHRRLQTRSFCFVGDLIEGLIRLMESPAEVTGPVNLGNPGEFAILELASLVIKLTGAGSEIAYGPSCRRSEEAVSGYFIGQGKPGLVGQDWAAGWAGADGEIFPVATERDRLERIVVGSSQPLG